MEPGVLVRSQLHAHAALPGRSSHGLPVHDSWVAESHVSARQAQVAGMPGLQQERLNKKALSECKRLRASTDAPDGSELTSVIWPVYGRLSIVTGLASVPVYGGGGGGGDGASKDGGGGGA